MIYLQYVPEWIGTILIVIPLVITGILVTIGITDKKARERTAERQIESDVLQEKIRSLYKEESNAQNEKIKDNQKEINDLSTRLASVEGENKTMRSILAGTDGKSVEYRARVEATLSLVTDQLAKSIIETSAGVKQMNLNVEKLLTALEKKL